MTSAKRPDGSVDYFAQHADKPAPNKVVHPSTVKNLKRPAATPTGPRQSDYSTEQQQELQDKAGA
jgi:hypothetical protein